ncbi:unnamed protein product [Urochloa humidicola]
MHLLFKHKHPAGQRVGILTAGMLLRHRDAHRPAAVIHGDNEHAAKHLWLQLLPFRESASEHMSSLCQPQAGGSQLSDAYCNQQMA